MDTIKTYIAEVVARKVVPAAIASALATLGTYFLAHAAILEQYGITYWQNFSGVFPQGQAPTGAVLVIEFDTFQKGVALLAVTGIGILMTILAHHTTAVVTGTPQSGDLRTTPNAPRIGGKREGDPQ